AFLDLNGLTDIEGIWKGSTTLPCAYVPEQDFEQQMLMWAVEHDKSSATVFRRDDSGDHILLSKYRDRVSVLKDTPGNVSLQILNLEMSDRGTYTCQVTWRMSNNSLIAREITTKLEVVKELVQILLSQAGPAQGGEQRQRLPPDPARPLCFPVPAPLRYRWFRGTPGTAPRLLRSESELAWGSLRPSDAGTYFCEAEGR
ncbi:V-set and immunoglobulin domain-containing protein 4, partial [Cuculus canorus]